MADPVHDWRGTAVLIGQTVIYGAPVGSSISMVEAEVIGFTRSGRVDVRPIRRAYGRWQSKDVVHVGPDRLTVIDRLPPYQEVAPS